jgi:hypothetical protein
MPRGREPEGPLMVSLRSRLVAAQMRHNMDTSGPCSLEDPMASVKMVSAAVVTVAAMCNSGCAASSGHDTAGRKVVATYAFWDGMGPPRGDPQFATLECAGTLTISNVDVTFTPGTSPGCGTPMHQRTVGTLRYDDLREIRVTRRPELLIFSTHSESPALRVTDWTGDRNFQRAVTLLQNAYESWKSRRGRRAR